MYYTLCTKRNSMSSMFIIALLLIIALSVGAYLYVRLMQSRAQLNRFAVMQVNYLFQERPGQYSGDYRSKSGVFVFRTVQKDTRLKNIVIKHVKPYVTDVVVNLEQIVVIPFEGKKDIFDVSVRFKMLRRNEETAPLEGKKIRIAGMLNFTDDKPRAFNILLPIGAVYRSQDQTDALNSK